MKTQFQLAVNKYIQPGMIALKRKGQVVYFGKISDPWEDVVCDSADVSKEDFDRLIRQLGEQDGD